MSDTVYQSPTEPSFRESVDIMFSQAAELIDMPEGLAMFIDIALAYAMLNFIAVLAASRYFQKRKGLAEEIGDK